MPPFAGSHVRPRLVLLNTPSRRVPAYTVDAPGAKPKHRTPPASAGADAGWNQPPASSLRKIALVVDGWTGSIQGKSEDDVEPTIHAVPAASTATSWNWSSSVPPTRKGPVNAVAAASSRITTRLLRPSGPSRCDAGTDGCEIRLPGDNHRSIVECRHVRLGCEERERCCVSGLASGSDLHEHVHRAAGRRDNGVEERVVAVVVPDRHVQVVSRVDGEAGRMVPGSSR